MKTDILWGIIYGYDRSIRDDLHYFLDAYTEWNNFEDFENNTGVVFWMDSGDFKIEDKCWRELPLTFPEVPDVIKSESEYIKEYIKDCYKCNWVEGPKWIIYEEFD